MDQRTVMSFDQLARKMRRDIPARDAKPRKASRPPLSLLRDFPEVKDVLHRGFIESQGPGFTVNVPREYGDEFAISSRGLTDWYVGEFCKLNHYKK